MELLFPEPEATVTMILMADPNYSLLVMLKTLLVFLMNVFLLMNETPLGVLQPLKLILELLLQQCRFVCLLMLLLLLLLKLVVAVVAVVWMYWW